MFSLLRILALTLCWIPFAAAHDDPESQIVIIENFLSSDTSRSLIQYYDSQNKTLSRTSDNQLTFSLSTNPSVRTLISAIASEILKVMKYSYGLNGKNYQVDHCALYARIPGNYCPYHADNVRFECPVHGKDQSHLRAVCNGECSGAKFVPNHTGWREYTALLYLNDHFQGGEILFEDGPCNKLYRKVIPIKANMLVITPNGGNFYHEVFPIRSGRRYSMHIWFTSDPSHFNTVIKAE